MDHSGFGHGFGHDDDELPSTDTPGAVVKDWSPDEALVYDAQAHEVQQWQFEMAEILKLTPNPYLWQVRPENQIPVHHASTPFRPGVSEALASFGRPTTETVKLYSELGARVAFDLKGAKQLSEETKGDLFLMLEASKPLNFGANESLGGPWADANDSYNGAKTEIALYGHLRSQMTKALKAVPIFVSSPAEKSNLNDVLKKWNRNKSFEIHHLNYKAIYPELATELDNLMLTQRSIRESEFGPGQHELMHLVASALSKDKFNVLAPQFTEVFIQWRDGHHRSGHGLLRQRQGMPPTKGGWCSITMIGLAGACLTDSTSRCLRRAQRLPCCAECQQPQHDQHLAARLRNRGDTPRHHIAPRGEVEPERRV